MHAKRVIHCSTCFLQKQTKTINDCVSTCVNGSQKQCVECDKESIIDDLAMAFVKCVLAQT